MTKNDISVELNYNSTWNNIVNDDDVYTAPIVIKRGQSDEATQFKPASISMQLENTDDKYRTTNPMSPLYGKAGFNTPTRVSVGSVVRGYVEASSLVCDQTSDFRASPKRGKAWVDFEGGGILQRIGQWSEPLESALYQYDLDTYSSVATGLFPMDDAKGSPTFRNTIKGASTRNFGSPGFESQKRAPGTGALTDLGESTYFSYNFNVVSPTVNDGYQFSFVTYLDAMGDGFYTPFQWFTADDIGISFIVDTTSDLITILIFDYKTVKTITSINYSLTYDFGGKWIMFNPQMTYSAGTVTVGIQWRAIDENFWTGVSHTYSGITSTIRRLDIIPFGTGGNAVGEVIAITGGGVGLDDETRFDAFKGWDTETTADRFARLCTLKGISYSIVGDTSQATVMGPQGVDTLSKQFEEIRDTEDGLIYDAIDSIGVVLKLRNYRYRQTAKITLYPEDFPKLPKEVNDDLGVFNVVTAQQRDGASFTVEDSTSVMGTQPPPNGKGEYRRTVNVNVSAQITELPRQANWWLNRGTVNLPRYPQVDINLKALTASQVTAIESIDIGDVLEIINYREYTIRLYVIGYTETLGTHSRKISFTCAPDQQFYSGKWDSSDSYWDSKTHFLKTAVDKSATSITLRSLSSKVVWGTTTPYDIMIAGERLTVTSMGSASLVSGGYDQTATVVRSVNGIVKALSANEEIHIATPGRWAL